MSRKAYGLGLAAGVCLGVAVCLLGPSVRADYTAELTDQIEDIEGRRVVDRDYFHDMGIVARKADEAELADFTAGIVKGRLFKPMEEYLKSGLDTVQKEYEAGNLDATRHLEILRRYERYYEATAEFLTTAPGQSLAAELVRLRRKALDDLKAGCSDDAISYSLLALRQTGLFVTNTGAEISDLRELEAGLDCCFSWKPKVHWKTENAFETDYDSGTVVEEANMSIQSNRRDLTKGEWIGDWITRFKGREGTGEGLTQAKLSYRKGSTTARLVMPPSKLSSVGRMNFPLNLSGSDRALEIRGQWINPKLITGAQAVSLTGCRDEEPMELNVEP